MVYLVLFIGLAFIAYGLWNFIRALFYGVASLVFSVFGRFMSDKYATKKFFDAHKDTKEYRNFENELEDILNK